MHDNNDLIIKHFHGISTPAERNELETRIASDSEALDLLVGHARLQVMLQELESTLCSDTAARRRRFLVPVIYAAAAAVLLLSFFIIFLHKGHEAVGTVSHLDSRVYIIRDGNTISAELNMTVRKGDILRTGNEGDAAVVFTDASTVRLGPDTYITINDKRFSELEKGTLLCRVIPDPDQSFRIRIIPTDTLVRVIGTKFRIEAEKEPIEKEGRMKAKTYIMGAMISVLSGTVAVRPAGAEEFLLAAHENAVIKAEGKGTPELLVNKNNDTISLCVHKKPFSELISMLEKAGNNIQIDSVSEKTLSTPISIHAQNIRYTNAVYWIAFQAGLCCEFTNGTVNISARDRLDNPALLHPAPYRNTSWFRDMEKKMEQKITAEFEEKPLADVLFELSQKSGIPVVIDPEVYRDISFDCYNACERYKHKKAVGMEDRCLGKIEDRKTTFSFGETSLKDAVFHVFKGTKRTIAFDPDVFTDRDGNPFHKPVTLRVNDMRIMTALNWIMRLTDINYRVTGEREIIFCKERSYNTAVHIYDIRDIIRNAELRKGIFEDRKSFEKWLIMHGPKELKEGKAGIKGTWVLKQGKLFVKGGFFTHKSLRRLFDNFRLIHRLPTPVQKQKYGSFTCEDHTCMQQEISVSYADAPLEYAVQDLNKKTGASIVLDPAALVDDHGAPEPINITYTARGQTFGKILKDIIHSAGLFALLKDNTLFISDSTVMFAFDVEGFYTYYMPDITEQYLKEAVIQHINSNMHMGHDDAFRIEAQKGRLIIAGILRVHKAAAEVLETFRMESNDRSKRVPPVPRRITWKGSTIPFRKALARIMTLSGLYYSVERESVLVSNNPYIGKYVKEPQWYTNTMRTIQDIRISSEFLNAHIKDIIQAISEKTGVKIQYDPELAQLGRKALPLLTVKFEDCSAEHALNILMQQADLEYRIEQHSIIISEDPDRKVNAAGKAKEFQTPEPEPARKEMDIF